MNHYSKRLARVLDIAKQTAIELKAQYILSEHLLFAILSDHDNVSAQFLLKLITIDAVKDILVIEKTPNNDPVFSVRVEKIMANAKDCAAQTYSEEIGTEHVLVGMLQEDCRATKFLNASGVNLQQMIRDIYASLGFKLNDKQQIVSYKGKPIGNDLETLSQLARNLNVAVENGEIGKVIGREKELNRLIQILGRKNKNNPVLVGDAGVGKTVIADALATRIVQGDVPNYLKDKQIYALDVGSLVAGTKYRGEFEERMKNLIEDVQRNKNIILFVDEIHMLVGAGGSEGSVDAANILKPALARGDIQLLGATTLSEYRKSIEKDAALDRRFSPVTVEEPSVSETITILKGVIDEYQSYHGVVIDEAAIVAAVELSERYINDRQLPDKAFDVLDEASAIVKNVTVKGKQPKQLLDTLILGKFNLSKKLLAHSEHQNLTSKKVVTTEIIEQVVSDWSNVPVTQLQTSERKRLLTMEKALSEAVVGQNEAIVAVSNAIRRAKSGISITNRPIGSFMFLGPTGVGKTELAKTLASLLFGSKDKMIRIDMSEYMERHNVSRLIGSPPGYVGFDEGGQLTEQVRRNPYSVVLFDEIEKAHPETFNILLQVLDDGFLTDSQGRKVDFRNTIIIMTSNLGATALADEKMVGFGASEMAKGQNNEKIIRETLKKTMRPEFLNRIDDIIVFKALEKDNMQQIVKLLLKQSFSHLEKQGIKLIVSPKAIERLVVLGYDPQYGARPLRRVIQKEIEDRLSIEMLKGTIQNDTTIKIGIKKDTFTVAIE